MCSNLLLLGGNDTLIGKMICWFVGNELLIGGNDSLIGLSGMLIGGIDLLVGGNDMLVTTDFFRKPQTLYCSNKVLEFLAQLSRVLSN